MKKIRNEIISTILYITGVLIVTALVYFYDKTPIYMQATRLWIGTIAIITFCFSFVFYIYWLVFKPFKKE